MESSWKASFVMKPWASGDDKNSSSLLFVGLMKLIKLSMFNSIKVFSGLLRECDRSSLLFRFSLVMVKRVLIDSTVRACPYV